MDAKKKKRIIVWTSVATILGIGSYLLYKWLKDSGKIGKGSSNNNNDSGTTTVIRDTPITSSGSSSGSSSSSSSSITEEQKALATNYRIWANSTDELAKKWGKPSKYDLDASSTTPYNNFFLRSYNGGGKAEYEKYLADQKATADAAAAQASAGGGNSLLEQIAAIAARYGRALDSSGTWGKYCWFYFYGKINQSSKQHLRLIISMKDNNGKNTKGESLIWQLRQYQYGKHIKTYSSGYLNYNAQSGKYSGSTAWGVGIGATVTNEGYLSVALEKLTSNQLDITDLGNFAA